MPYRLDNKPDGQPDGCGVVPHLIEEDPPTILAMTELPEEDPHEVIHLGFSYRG
jgi:hypothetical protein